MNAIDYFKKYGLVESKEHLAWMTRAGARIDIHGGFMSNLKRLVESHELVEKVGGLDDAQHRLLHLALIDSHKEMKVLASAIADVESCQ